MIPKYLVTLVTTVVVVAFAAASLPFATSSQVLSGKSLSESLRFEFTIDADSNHMYQIDPDLAQFLQAHIGFHTEGPPRIVSVKTEVTPKPVSWSAHRTTVTAPGAALTVQLHWDTPATAADGSRGSIYLDFPEIPGLEGKAITLRSGPYQKDNAGRYFIREVTTYRSSSLLALARFVFALSVGLPFAILLHSIYWAFVLKGEKRSRLSELTGQNAGLPQTFYPDPIKEWTAWLIALSIGSFVSSILAGLSILDSFMSSAIMTAVYLILVITATAAILAACFTRRYVLTVRVSPEGIYWARGREDSQWMSATWSDIRRATQKFRTYRGSTAYWIEIEFNDNRKKLKIGQSVTGYPALCDILTSRTAR